VELFFGCFAIRYAQKLLHTHRRVLWMQYILFRYLIALALEPTSHNNFVASYQQSLMFAAISALEIQRLFTFI
jgi:hypothetical protein